MYLKTKNNKLIKILNIYKVYNNHIIKFKTNTINLQNIIQK